MSTHLYFPDAGVEYHELCLAQLKEGINTWREWQYPNIPLRKFRRMEIHLDEQGNTGLTWGDRHTLPLLDYIKNNKLINSVVMQPISGNTVVLDTKCDGELVAAVISILRRPVACLHFNRWLGGGPTVVLDTKCDGELAAALYLACCYPGHGFSVGPGSMGHMPNSLPSTDPYVLKHCLADWARRCSTGEDYNGFASFLNSGYDFISAAFNRNLDRREWYYSRNLLYDIVDVDIESVVN